MEKTILMHRECSKVKLELQKIWFKNIFSLKGLKEGNWQGCTIS